MFLLGTFVEHGRAMGRNRIAVRIFILFLCNVQLQLCSHCKVSPGMFECSSVYLSFCTYLVTKLGLNDSKNINCMYFLLIYLELLFRKVPEVDVNVLIFQTARQIKFTEKMTSLVLLS